MFQTGIPTCDALREIAFTGNIIPQIWYHVFVKRDLKHPKPHLLAINILADIVYWYRPTEVRDECTGALIGYRKKFSGDLLQRSYSQIAEQFGCSERQAKDAIVFLEEFGVVKRDLRVIETRGTVCNNVLFLALDVQRLREVTYPAETPEPPVTKSVHTCDEILPEGCRNLDTPVPEFVQTYTENTTKTSTEISNTLTDGLTDPHECGNKQQSAVENPETFIRQLRQLETIPKAITQDLKQVRILVNWLCEYDYFMRYAPEKTALRDAAHQQTFTLFVDCLGSMICAKGEQNYTGDVVRPSDVLDALRKVSPDLGCGDLDEFALSCVNAFCDAMENRNIQNVKSYMKSIIWNGFSEFPVNRETF